MDTLLIPRHRFDKSAICVMGIGIVFSLILTQNMLSFGQDIEYNTGVSPNINIHIQNEIKEDIEFRKSIERKYPGAQIYEVEKGIYHIHFTRYFQGRPVRLNVLEISTDINDELEIEPAIASTILPSKSKISSIAKKNNAIVAINGGYFKPQTGVPLGTLMIDKKVYTGPIYDRVAMGFFDNSYDMARVKLNASIKTNIGGFKIDNINQPRMLSTHTIVYTRDWGKITPQTPRYGSQLVVNKGKLVGLSTNPTEIPEDGFVIVGPTKILEPMTKAKRFKIDLKIDPKWDNVNHIISGGPYLVKNEEVFVDMTAQKLSSIGGRNPRTAIGYTKDNNLIMLTADGREGASVGLTLIELANLMKEFGCVNAMNLDGGGSTVMYVEGKVVNKPAVTGGIPLSHSLTVKYKDFS